MTPAQSPSEVVILGGGPAGCAAARLLATWGHAVRQFAPVSGRGGTLAQSIPPSCARLFDTIGVTGAIDAAGFVRSTGNTVWWGAGERRIESFADAERGWQVTADALDDVLLESCRRAGVQIESARVSAADVDVEAASFVLDCTGRSGTIARARGLRAYDDVHRTVALTATWRLADWPLPDSTHTAIESYDDGWAWSVPLPSGARCVAVMVDPRTSHLARGDGAHETYRAELRKTRQFAAILKGATLEGSPAGWDASMYGASRYTDGNVLLVGDAASFIDPLSSAGIKKALASGWLAAVAVHTALVNPSMRDAALAFFAAREAEVYDSVRHMTAQYLTLGAAAHDHPFWSDRQAPVDAGADDDLARAAWERIRDAPHLRLRQVPGIRVEPRAAVSGCEIVMESRVISTAAPGGVRFVRDVDAVQLLDLAPSSDRVPDLFERYCRRCGPVALPDFLAALSTAVARGWLSWS